MEFMVLCVWLMKLLDTFHEYDKKGLLDEFRADTYKAIERKISLNPVFTSFSNDC